MSGVKLREVAIEELLGRSAKRGEPGAVERADVEALRQKLAEAEALLDSATRFVFGNHQAIVFPGDGPNGWRVYRMNGTVFESVQGKSMSRADAVALAQRLHAETFT